MTAAGRSSLRRPSQMAATRSERPPPCRCKGGLSWPRHRGCRAASNNLRATLPAGNNLCGAPPAGSQRQRARPVAAVTAAGSAAAAADTTAGSLGEAEPRAEEEWWAPRTAPDEVLDLAAGWSMAARTATHDGTFLATAQLAESRSWRRRRCYTLTACRAHQHGHPTRMPQPRWHGAAPPWHAVASSSGRG